MKSVKDRFMNHDNWGSTPIKNITAPVYSTIRRTISPDLRTGQMEWEQFIINRQDIVGFMVRVLKSRL